MGALLAESGDSLCLLRGGERARRKSDELVVDCFYQALEDIGDAEAEVNVIDHART